MPNQPGKMLTRRDVPPYVRAKFGIPVTKSTIDKSRMKYDEPKPDGFYGNKELFTEPTIDEFALSLVTKEPAKLIAE